LPASPGVELDVRGMRADEAVERLEEYIDRAYTGSLPWVRIIHGKGTGRLREVIRKALKANTSVQSFEGGHDGEGGEGVTVAKIKAG